MPDMHAPFYTVRTRFDIWRAVVLHGIPEAARLTEFRNHLKEAYRLSGQSEAAAALDTSK